MKAIALRSKRSGKFAQLIYACGLTCLLLGWGESRVDGETHARPKLFTFTHHAMATTFTLYLYSGDADSASAVSEEVFDEVDRVEQLLSNYRDRSELSRMNRDAAAGPVTTDPEMMGFLVQAEHWSRVSDGADATFYYEKKRSNQPTADKPVSKTIVERGVVTGASYSTAGEMPYRGPGEKVQTGANGDPTLDQFAPLSRRCVVSMGSMRMSMWGLDLAWLVRWRMMRFFAEQRMTIPKYHGAKTA